MKIARRYIYFEIIKVLILFLGLLFFLFSIVDFSLHIKHFIKTGGIPLSKIFLYYIFEFCKSSKVLFSLATLIATIKVLCSLNTHHEWFAFQTCGIATKRLLRPFISIAFFMALLSYANFQWLYPKALGYIERFEKTYLYPDIKKQKHKSRLKKQVIHLKDGSKLLFLYNDLEKKILFDIYWFTSQSELWHCKYLDYSQNPPQGTWVDMLTREKKTGFKKTASYETYRFFGMKLKEVQQRNPFVLPENRSITSLFSSFVHQNSLVNENMDMIKTAFYYKLIAPLSPFLIVFAIVPFCLQHSRRKQIFLIYALGLMGTIGFYVLLDALVVFGENGVISPLLSITGLPVLLVGIFYWNFRKCL